MFKHLAPCTALLTTTTALSAETTALYHCTNNLPDHGLEVTFFGDRTTGEIARATLSEQSLMGPRTVSELNVCTRLTPPDFPADDSYVNTFRCNDVDWRGYDANLFEGGLSGIPFVVVTRVGNPEDELLRAHCRTLL